jgi:hypothetical protein
MCHRRRRRRLCVQKSNDCHSGLGFGDGFMGSVLMSVVGRALVLCRCAQQCEHDIDGSMDGVGNRATTASN